MTRALTDAEMKAQGDRCGCRGADDYCVCQNVPDAITRKDWELQTEPAAAVAVQTLADWLRRRADAEPEATRFEEGRRKADGTRTAECTLYDADAHFVVDHLTGGAARRLGEALGDLLARAGAA